VTVMELISELNSNTEHFDGSWSVASNSSAISERWQESNASRPDSSSMFLQERPDVRRTVPTSMRVKR